MGAAERPVTAVPRAVMVLLALALAAQITIGSVREGPATAVSTLPWPPSVPTLRVVALGEEAVLARLIMLWLQAFDYQPGVSIPFHALDYGRLEAWLERALTLDPGFQYPLLAAVRLYGDVADADRQRRMIAFVRRHFVADPQQRWQWMAHAVYLAKHRLGDLELALALAEELAAAPPDPAIPSWARQMHIFVREDMGEIESAKVLLGGLLESGEITDPHERWFLSQRLHELEARSDDAGTQGKPSSRAASADIE
ncbi:MAG: hypothetical protein WD928_08135 [Gammaproteobacteria bacterium]